jgi:hypothetical protein
MALPTYVDEMFTSSDEKLIYISNDMEEIKLGNHMAPQDAVYTG